MQGHPKEWHPVAGEGLTVLCHSSQAGGSSSCPPALPPEPCPKPHRPFPASGDSGVVLGVPVLPGVTLQAGPVTASMGLAWGALLHCPPWGKWFLHALQILHVPPNPGQDNRPCPVCVLQGGPADRQGGDSSAAASASLSGARHAAPGQHGCWQGCGTRGSPVAPGAPHTSPVVPAWGHSGPLYHCGVQGHRARLPSSTEQGWQARSSTEIIPWG